MVNTTKEFHRNYQDMLSFLHAEYKKLQTGDASLLAADRKIFLENFRKESEKKVRKTAALEHRLIEKAIPFHQGLHSMGIRRSENVTT